MIWKLKKSSFAKAKQMAGQTIRSENRNSQSISQTFEFVFPAASQRQRYESYDELRYLHYWLDWDSQERQTNFDIQLRGEFTPPFNVSYSDHPLSSKDSISSDIPPFEEGWRESGRSVGGSDICHHSGRCNSLCLPFPSDFLLPNEHQRIVS